MKRIISFILIFIGLSCVKAEAQNFFAQDDDNPVMNDGPKVFLSIGPTAGVTMATFSLPSDASYSYGYRTGFTAGGFLNFRFLNRNIRSTAETGVLAIQPEIRFSMIGGNCNSNEDSAIGLNYVTIPIMFQVYPTANLYLEAGPDFGFNVSHTPDNIVFFSEEDLVYTEYNLENMKANDVAAAIGVGYRFWKLSIGARYHFGLSDLAENMQWKNRWIQVGISFSIPMTKKHSIFD